MNIGKSLIILVVLTVIIYALYKGLWITENASRADKETVVDEAVQVSKNNKKLFIESVKTHEEVQIDGVKDKIWDQAPGLSVLLNELPYEPDNGYEGQKQARVELRTLYDESYLYFYVRWDDEEKDLARFPWQKQKDGSWKQLMNKDSTLHENTYYEDKFSFYWNINQRGFIKKGCDKSCHMIEDGLLEGVADTSAGRHFTSSQQESLDEWHWKAMRSNTIGQMDDGYVDAERETNEKWGRHSDTPNSGGYFDNKNKETGFPLWMNADNSGDKRYWIDNQSKQQFVDTFAAGDILGGIVADPFKGARGDVIAKGTWKDGYWTLEIKRKLLTDHDNSGFQDVQFNDLDKPYYFGVTAFDNSQINHIYHKKSIELRFRKDS